MTALNLYQFFGIPAMFVGLFGFVVWVILASVDGYDEGHGLVLGIALIGVAVWLPLMILDINRAPKLEDTCASNEIFLHKDEALVYVDRIVLVPEERCYAFVAKGV